MVSSIRAHDLERSIAMASIPIHNETTYTLTDDITQQIIRDAQEHFGEEVRAIRVQSGLERHALNARTWEVRYAFFPQDFGLGHPMPTVHAPFDPAADLPTRDEATADAILPTPFEDVEEEDIEEDTEPLETSLESLDEGQDDEEEDDVFTLDAPVEDTDEDDEDNVLDDEEDNVFEDDEV
jgi:hypothetical protein